MKINIKRIALSLCALMACAAVSFAEDITGKVVGSANQPIPDVVVTCSGCATVRTGADGTYTIKDVKDGSTLNFVREGYYPQSQLVKNAAAQKSLNIHMVETSKSRYNETSILATGKVENNGIIPGVSNLNRKDFALGSMSVDKALQGQVTGLNVVNKSGMPGEGSYLQLRGVKSLVAENAPLIVVNGVPYMPSNNESSIILGYSPSALQAFNNKDIRNITVLKGSEASIFGSLGSNGVIMIETDQATSTDVNTRITFSALYGHNWNNTRIPMMDAAQYKGYLSDMGLTYYPNQEAFFKDFGFLSDPTGANANLFQYNTNWQNEIYRSSNTQDYLFRVEGGDNIAKYNISLGYMKNEGTVKGTDTQRYNAQVNASMLVCRQLEIQAAINAAYLTGKYQEQSLRPETSPMIAAYRHSPLLSPYASDMYGNLISSYSSYWYGNIQNTDFMSSNPAAIVNELTSKARQYDMNSKISAVFTPIRNLVFTGTIAMYYNFNQERTFIPGVTSKDIVPLFDQYGSADNSVQIGSLNTFNMYYALNGRYQLDLNKYNKLNFLAGFQALTTDTEYDAAFGRNTPNDFYQTLGNSVTLGRYFSGYNNKWNWMNWYAHADYRYMDYLKAGITATWDGASSIGKDTNRFSFYPAGELELYLKPLLGLRMVDFINNINVYGNYGLTGNSRFASKLGKYYYTSTPYQTIAGIIRANVPNTKIKAETDYTLNVGVNSQLWNNRLDLSVGYYDIDARNVLMTGLRSSVLGTSVYYNNDARIKSSGIEASLSVMPVHTRDFTWMIGGNITTLDNKVKSLGNLNEIVTDLSDGGQIITMVGEKPFSFYGYQTDGVYSTTAEAKEANLTNSVGVKYQAGDVKFVDQNGDHVINDADKVLLGSATPDFFGSFFTRFEYKGFALDLNFVYSHGNNAYNAVRRITESGKDFSNQSTALLRRWSMEGQVTDMPRAVYGDKVGNNCFSDRWIEDASYLKLRDITLSYTWNKNWLNFLQGGTVFVTAENLFCSTKYLGVDPEFSYSGSTLMQGVDYGKVAAPRSVKFGVNLKF